MYIDIHMRPTVFVYIYVCACVLLIFKYTINWLTYLIFVIYDSITNDKRCPVLKFFNLESTIVLMFVLLKYYFFTIFSKIISNSETKPWRSMFFPGPSSIKRQPTNQHTEKKQTINFEWQHFVLVDTNPFFLIRKEKFFERYFLLSFIFVFIIYFISRLSAKTSFKYSYGIQLLSLWSCDN